MSEFRRFFVDKIDSVTTIEGDEFHHAVSVLRIKQGEKVILCDNSGYEYLGIVSEIAKKQISVKVESKELSTTETKNKVILIAGYLKGDKTELVVQKAVELGVREIVVFNSKFCSSYINDNKLSRLNRVSVEASKQCGRAIAPKVIYKDTFKEALECALDYKNKIFACEFSQGSEIDISVLSGSTAIVVGSEGGFSPEEAKLATQLGYKTISLGKRILRAETACLALTSIVMNSLGELK